MWGSPLLEPACGSEDSAGSGSGLPGGTAGKSVLAEHDFLDKDDRVRFGESKRAAEVQSAICDHIFGKPEEVATPRSSRGEVSLNEGSGYNSAGGNGGRRPVRLGRGGGRPRWPW